MADAGLHQTQGLALQQTITPQMQQSLQVLQAPTFELRQLVQQEMMENPVLEEQDEFTEPPTEESEASPEEAPANSDGFDEEFEQLARLDDDWRDYMIQNRRLNTVSADDEERRDHLMESLVAPDTLQAHLMQQLSMADVSQEDRQATELLIGMVDDNGFLTASIEEIALTERLPIEPLRRARALLQSFHPVGVGAVDLRECLLIQLVRLGKEHSLENRIVANHLEDLAMKRYPMLAKKFGVTVQQIAQAADFISSLNPRPGRMFSPDHNSYVNADVMVERDSDGEWQVILNNNEIPRLRISNAYKDIMSEGGQDSDVRRYIRDKIRNGKFLIRSIQQRQETIEKIAREIVRHQTDFLEHGPSHLRPLNMAQVAETVGVHETTVSRAVSGKYMTTPRGTFEMKYFFTTGYKTSGGEELSNTSVKNALVELVKNEPAGRAYSDDELVALLHEQGVPIARRTVAKYRQQLNILPSHMRRKF